MRDKSKSHGEKKAIVLHENKIHFSCQWGTCEISHHHIFPRCLSSTSHALRIRQVFHASDSLNAEHQLPTQACQAWSKRREITSRHSPWFFPYLKKEFHLNYRYWSEFQIRSFLIWRKPHLKKEFHFSTDINNDMHKFSVQQAWMSLPLIWSEPQLAHLSPGSSWKLSFGCSKPVLGV